MAPQTQMQTAQQARPSRRPDEPADEKLGQPSDRANSSAVSKRRTIVTTTTTTTRENGNIDKSQVAEGSNPAIQESLAVVEDLGRRAVEQPQRAPQVARKSKLTDVSSVGKAEQQVEFEQQELEPANAAKLANLLVEGNKFVSTIGTIAAQSSQSRIVACLLKDGLQLQLRIQEMRPGLFEVGTNLSECRKYLAEHQKLLENLNKHKRAPLEGWMAKFRSTSAALPNMSTELRLVYMCMAENLQSCWRGLLLQLEQRMQLLDESCKFFESAERLLLVIERADKHVQAYRREFLDGPGSIRFSQATDELRRLNGQVLEEFLLAKRRQRRLVQLVGKMAAGNLADSRPNLLVGEAQTLIDFIEGHIGPLERRKIQLENVITTTTTTRASANKNTQMSLQPDQMRLVPRPDKAEQWKRRTTTTTSQRNQIMPVSTSSTTTMRLRDIENFNDLMLAEGWLNAKVDQLNSSLLLSLGSSAQDTRSILNKHEQIALECSAIEEATLNFNRRNIHAIKPAPPGDQTEPGGSNAAASQCGRPSLFEQQRALATRTRDVIAILDARITLLRRTIEFYARARDATSDINKMMRRLQVDNSLQSVQFVADELALKDVSSVVASGATIISELQQLQLAQQHGQRSEEVGLGLATDGIRAVIDQLNQDLAHLKTVLNQRRLVLLNEDAAKMAQNFTTKCRQLRFWLDNQVRGLQLANGRIGFDVLAVRAYIETHERLRVYLQQKTLEVEALLRLLSTLTENFDTKSGTADELQRDSDELRQEWISATNCIERRLEFAAKYLTILMAVNEQNRNLDLLGRAANETAGGAARRPRTPDERTDEDTKSAIEQGLAQLASQVKNFTMDAQRSNTALVHSYGLDTKPITSDINKQQVVGHANGSLKLLTERHKSILSKLNSRRPLKWTAAPRSEQPEPQSQRKDLLVNGARPQAPPQEQATTGPPKFVRQLVDAEVEPFSTAELECELDGSIAPSATCRVEWLLNNKRIPHTIKHSTDSEGSRYRLTIGQFGPICCGIYTARATNQLGQTSSSSCRLRLCGIREDEDPPARLEQQAQQQKIATENQRTSAPATKWRNVGGNKWQQQMSKERALERIIQGVESPMGHEECSAERQQSTITSTTTTTTTINNQNNTGNETNRFPVTQLSYDGSQRLASIDSPARSETISRSPFEGTPQPPAFMQSLREQLTTADDNCLQTGLVCVVVGNPPPNVEWLHEGRPIASAKCPRPESSPRANICKLTIETMNDKTLGQYVCRATNRLGQSTTALTLGQ